VGDSPSFAATQNECGRVALVGSNTGSMWASRPHSYRAQWFKPAFSNSCLLYYKACAAEAAGLHFAAGGFALGDDLPAFKIGGFFYPVLL
jgi:hypothetical protein